MGTTSQDGYLMQKEIQISTIYSSAHAACRSTIIFCTRIAEGHRQPSAAAEPRGHAELMRSPERQEALAAVVCKIRAGDQHKEEELQGAWEHGSSVMVLDVSACVKSPSILSELGRKSGSDGGVQRGWGECVALESWSFQSPRGRRC